MMKKFKWQRKGDIVRLVATIVGLYVFYWGAQAFIIIPLFYQPHYVVACVGPGAQSLFHNKVVRFATNGDTTSFYLSGDFRPTVSVKNMICMISKLTGEEEERSTPQMQVPPFVPIPR